MILTLRRHLAVLIITTRGAAGRGLLISYSKKRPGMLIKTYNA
jgi:hypothetical protein